MSLVTRRRAITATAIVGGLTVAAVAVSKPEVHLSLDYQPATAITTKTEFDTEGGRLILACLRSDSGTCNFVLDEHGWHKTLTVEAGKSATLTNVAASDRLCSTGSKPVPDACEWAPLMGDAATREIGNNA